MGMSISFSPSPLVVDIAAAIAAAGGRAFVVGGAVRDLAAGRNPQDLDIEVIGLPVDSVVAAVSVFGQVDVVGASHPVVWLHGSGIEISVADDDSPFAASCRRDFSINAMMIDILSGDLLDFHGGQADLAAGILRNVSARFADDPLRVLRGMRFAGMFNLAADSGLIDLAGSLVGFMPSLPADRVWGEWWDWASRSVVPSAGLRFLVQSGWAGCFGLDIDAAVLARVDAAAAHGGIVVLAALLAQASPAAVRSVLNRAPSAVAARIVAMVNHWQVLAGVADGDSVSALLLSLGAAASFADVASLAQVTGLDVSNWMVLVQNVNAVHGLPAPIVQGRDLIARGWQAGPALGAAVRAAFAAQLAGRAVDVDQIAS
jgi:tRNA nucleotidyltransferase (CCA-adding enzyme)